MPKFQLYAEERMFQTKKCEPNNWMQFLHGDPFTTASIYEQKFQLKHHASPIYKKPISTVLSSKIMDSMTGQVDKMLGQRIIKEARH